MHINRALIALFVAGWIAVLSPPSYSKTGIYVTDWVGSTITTFSNTNGYFAQSGEIDLNDARSFGPEIQRRESGLIELQNAAGETIWVHELSVTTSENTNVVLPDCAEMKIATETTQQKGTMNLGNPTACR